MADVITPPPEVPDTCSGRVWLLLVALLLAAPLLAEEAEEAAPEPIFTEEAAAVGIDFVHWNGMTGRFYYPEVVGSGGALFDYDGDGDLDLYLVQGQRLGPAPLEEAIFPPPSGPLTDRLYRNDLEVAADGSRRLRFTDVTAESGITGDGYGMGVAAGDVDGDGFVDLYVTHFGPDRLWHNQGDGTFRDATEAAGLDDRRWNVPASFADFDGDGRLDLYAGGYAAFSVALNKACIGESGLRDYCGPQSYDPVPDRLYLNRSTPAGADGGGLRFDDVSESAGITGAFGPTLGVATADFDGDGRVDVYVANDQAANQLWLNQGVGEDGRIRFVDDALLLGCALNRDGVAEASMGVDAADFDGDGDEDLFMTHLTRESNTLFVNDGHGLFHDRSLDVGVANPSWQYTGFGTAFFDYDNDGWLDLFAANGAVYLIFELRRDGDPYPLHQPNQLFRNLGPAAEGEGHAGFEEVTGRVGPAFETSEVSRGAVFGDVDDDGDVDVVVVNNSGPARLLINRVGNRNHWLGLRPVAGDPPRDQPGTRVVVHHSGGPPLHRRVRTDGSYASASDPRLIVGLGDDPAVTAVEVRWPDGAVERWKGLDADRYHTLRRGDGESVESVESVESP